MKRVLFKRSISPFSRWHQFRRMLWDIVWMVFFRPSPRPFHGWRRWLLRLFGARIDSTAYIYPGARIWAPWMVEIGAQTGIADGAVLYSQGLIRIGDRCVISQGAYICTGTHDYVQEDFPLVVRPVVIGDDVWIAARAFIHPGVELGHGVVVAACAVVIKSIPSYTVVAGNPAYVIKNYEKRKNID